MKKFFSERMRGVEKTLIRRVNDLADSSCIDLGLGELRFPTPKSILGHIKEKSEDWDLGYTPNEGLQELRDLVAEKCGYSVSPDQVCITVGAEEAVFAALMVLVNPGDEVLVPDPGYPAYPLIVKMAGGLPRTYPLYPENHFGLKAEDVEGSINDRTKAVIINSPNNPTGAVYSKEEIAALAKILEEREILVISDEVYRDIYFEGEPDSIARHVKNFVAINSLSKSFSMTGWRLGWCIAPPELIKLIATFHHLAVACAPAISQHAAVFALKGNAEEERLKNREELRRRRDFALRCLDQFTDLKYIKPAGAFYIFANIINKIPEYGSSLDISMNLLKREKVVTIPGIAFGERGEGFLRISFSAPPEQIKEGIRRIGRFFKS
jgi:aspartate/methionine/tyrosine aminotransferase